jgi:hypothetical protein
MGTIGHLSRSAGKALATCSTEPRPLDESMVYKRYWLDVLAALDLPHSRWHDYADLRVMPTSARSPLWRKESRLMGSA